MLRGELGPQSIAVHGGVGLLFGLFTPQNAPYTVPLRGNAVNDKHIVPSLHHGINAGHIPHRLKRRTQGDGVELEVIGIEACRLVLCVNEADFRLRPEVLCQRQGSPSLA